MARPARRSGAGGTLLGLFIGIAVGLSLAAAVAFYLMKAGNPYQSSAPSKEAAREPAKTAKAEQGAADKPRFDFYKILPGAEEARAQAERKPAEKPDRGRRAYDAEDLVVVTLAHAFATFTIAGRSSRSPIM